MASARATAALQLLPLREPSGQHRPAGHAGPLQGGAQIVVLGFQPLQPGVEPRGDLAPVIWPIARSAV